MPAAAVLKYTNLSSSMASCSRRLCPRSLALHGPAPSRTGSSKATFVSSSWAKSAKGLAWHMAVDDADLMQRMVAGAAAIRAEVAEHGTDEDKECLEYVLNAEAGSSDKLFSNSCFPRDCDANGLREDRKKADGTGMRLADFAAGRQAETAGLALAHVLAIRLYSTAAYKSLNNPLRDRNRHTPHPFAATVTFLAEGLRRLRAVGAAEADATEPLDLWRGMAQTGIGGGNFFSKGGSELAPMSTTADPQVAFGYAASAHALVFKVHSKSFMDRGPDISWCSAFPAEREYLYPPLTYLQPTKRREVVRVEQAEIQVVEVEPRFGS